MQLKQMKVPKREMVFLEDTDIQLSENEEGVQYFSMLAYSGKVIKGRAFWGGDLAIDVSGIEFKGKRFPILEQHELDRKIGVANTKPSLDGNQVFFEKINLLKNESAQEFKSNLDEGFPYQASIGIRPLVIEEIAEGAEAEVNGYKLKGPGSVIRKSMFKEASVCVFGADPNTASFSDEEESLEVSIVNLTEENKGGVCMSLDQLKEVNVQLHDEVMSKLNDKDTELSELKDALTQLQAEKDSLESSSVDLIETVKKYELRLTELERQESIRKEQVIRASAEKIIDQKLQEHNIPVRLHSKVKKVIDFNEFVENDALDSVKFTEAVEAEVKEWTFEEQGSPEPKVMGFSAEGTTDADDTDADVDRLFNYVMKK